MMLSDISLWINMQLEMNSQIPGFEGSDLYKVCVNDVCLAIEMPTTTIIPSASPTITGNFFNFLFSFQRAIFFLSNSRSKNEGRGGRRIFSVFHYGSALIKTNTIQLFFLMQIQNK